MENKNHGILIGEPRASDYILGSDNQIQLTRSVKDWSIYLSHPYDTQRSTSTDFLDCVTFSAAHTIEMQLNYLLSTNQLSDEVLHFFHTYNYIKDGVFKISKRFNAKLNQTDILKGQYLTNAGDCLRRDGIVPEDMWPATSDMTWDQYYAPVPQNIIDLGKKAKQFISIQYQLTSGLPIANILKVSPLQVATEVCAGWDSGQIVQKCSGQSLQHSTVIYGLDGSNNFLDLDQYPPFLQKLASDYELPYSIQYIITMPPIVLRSGMVGSNVLTLQKELNILGYNLVKDSFYGNKTVTAVINFQNKTGLKADGIAGPLTLAKLKDMSVTPVLNIKDIITSVCNKNGIEPELGIAVASCEGGLKNAKITRLNTDSHHSTDRGIFQFNSYWYAGVSDAEAFDPAQATQRFCDIVKEGKLVEVWHLSQHCWAPSLPTSIRQKYGV